MMNDYQTFENKYDVAYDRIKVALFNKFLSIQRGPDELLQYRAIISEFYNELLRSIDENFK